MDHLRISEINYMDNVPVNKQVTLARKICRLTANLLFPLFPSKPDAKYTQLITEETKALY